MPRDDVFVVPSSLWLAAGDFLSVIIKKIGLGRHSPEDRAGDAANPDGIGAQLLTAGK